MTGFDDFSRLTEVLSAIHSADAEDFPQALDELTGAAARSVAGAQHAGITVSNHKKQVTTPSVTHECARLLDEFQHRHLEGPCLEAAWTRATITVDDLASDSRWPKYQADALAYTPIRSVLSLPMFAGELTMGALNLYAEDAHAFSESSRRVATTFATLGALAWSNVLRQQQFSTALHSRDIIGRAKGILMERYGLDDEAAFDVLVELSQSTNIPVRDLAERLNQSNHTAASRRVVSR